MAGKVFRLNRAGVSKILKSDGAGQMATDVAERVGAAVRSEVDAGVDVRVTPYTTDRGAASVTIAHPHGAAMQASDGALTKAAAAVGLTVTSR